MLDRNLYYTGVTRSQSDSRLIGQHKALATAASRQSAVARRTHLAERIHEMRAAAHPDDGFELRPEL